jgi:hypothetical protein
MATGNGWTVSVTTISKCASRAIMVGIDEEAELQSTTGTGETHAAHHLHGLEHMEREMSTHF